MRFAGASGKPAIGMVQRFDVPAEDEDRIIFSGGRIGDELHVSYWLKRPMTLNEGRSVAAALSAMVSEVEGKPT